ncbi:hypothetical protein PHMEG_00029120 [Phytophthora megakarya]|uniref:Reverse transcriptase/retrotransposon-derived protein RNase H-like domain-containing protein n=1 Tax=Phytophthora megakarya TaxID=4795 RepID=A0A225V4F8_9STRA|nr:hypothetical protein PHMEG_00029120 [Phytophthora megakarya]
MIDNALWGFVQPKGGWRSFADKMRAGEDLVKSKQERSAKHSTKSWGEPPIVNTNFVENRDPVLKLVNEPTSDMFVTNEVDESALVPVFDRRSFVDDICFGGKTFDDCLMTLDRLLGRFTEYRISISISFTKIFGAALYQLKDDDFEENGDLTTARRSFDMLKQKVAEAPILRYFDRTKEVHIMLFVNEWALSTTFLQLHEDKLHPVRFCGRVLKDAEMNYHPAEKEVLALLLLLKTCYTQLAGRTLHVYTRFSTLEWITKSKSLFGRAVQWAVLLSPWHLIVQRVKEKDCAFTRFLQSTVTNFVDIDDSLELVAPPQKGSPTARIDPQLLYARLPLDYSGLVVSFDGSAKTEKNGGYGSCAWVVWRLPEWTIVLGVNNCERRRIHRDKQQLE